MSNKCYIIAFELKENITSLTDAIKGYGTWAKITQNTWAIVTNKSAVEIRNHLNSFINEESGDRLFVVKSGVEAAWKNVICTNEWLKENL